MNLDFKKLFVSGRQKPNSVIRVSRNMQLAPIDEGTRHVEAGEEITVSHATLTQLDPSDYTMLDSGIAPVPVPDPSPPRQAANPLPDRWDELPSCFADYWTITEEFRTANEHVAAISQARAEVFGTNFTIGNQEGTALIGGVMSANSRGPFSGGVFSSLKPIDMDDPKLRKLDRMLTAAHNSAVDYYNRLIDTKSIAQQRAFLACGGHRLAVADELRVVLDELATIGFEIFSCRTAALGLAEFQQRRLYHGGSDYQKYNTHGTAIIGSVSSAGLDTEKQPIIYSDSPVSSQAGWALDMTARLAELRPLLKTAKAELARAQKASMAAA